jgi:hypothetical protein
MSKNSFSGPRGNARMFERLTRDRSQFPQDPQPLIVIFNRNQNTFDIA